ncbi:MAG: NusG domain II-containing protein, partial [Clostridia bacterium]|nr:NusG domain II-containing protein [Clostridia bacterium]
MNNKKKIKNDIILAVVIVLIAAAGLLLFVFNREQGSTVSVKVDGIQIASYPLAENREVSIKTGDNDEHINVLVIKDGKASISEADCPDKICV